MTDDDDDDDDDDKLKLSFTAGTLQVSCLKHVEKLDIVGTVYHLVIYMQSNKIHNVVLMTEFFIHHIC